MVKIWGAKPSKGGDGGASEAKKARSDSTAAKPVTRTPLRTLGGHKEAISGVAWHKEEGFLYLKRKRTKNVIFHVLVNGRYLNKKFSSFFLFSNHEKLNLIFVYVWA